MESMPGVDESAMKYGGLAILIGYVIVAIIIVWWTFK